MRDRKVRSGKVEISGEREITRMVSRSKRAHTLQLRRPKKTD